MPLGDGEPLARWVDDPIPQAMSEDERRQGDTYRGSSMRPCWYAYIQ